MKRWTKVQKELMGYKRREAYLDKEDVTLPEPPWKDREISVAPLPEVQADLKGKDKWTKD